MHSGSMLVINSGAWVNNVGTINLSAGAQTSTLAFNNTQPILLGSATDAGQLVMTDNPGNRITGVTGEETLINNAAHTIQGAGTIANFGGGFVNNGMVIANGVNPLVIDISAATAAAMPDAPLAESPRWPTAARFRFFQLPVARC